MQTLIIPTTDPTAIPRAMQILKSGGLVAFPTDTVYGLAALLTDASAIDRLYEAKERTPNKAIAVLIGDLAQLNQVGQDLSPIALRLAAHFWPGALTLVVARRPGLPENLSPLPTIGVRMPDHPFALVLLCQTGPLATTSANLSGGPNPRMAAEVLDQLNGRVELVLDGGDAPGGVPSTVVDCTSTAFSVLRAGAIPLEQIQAIINNRT